jgi:hypothetical protein
MIANAHPRLAPRWRGSKTTSRSTKESAPRRQCLEASAGAHLLVAVSQTSHVRSYDLDAVGTLRPRGNNVIPVAVSENGNYGGHCLALTVDGYGVLLN